MTGKALGLVLGGGGTRGWAEVGAIRALIEKDIMIDAVGGTSIGAILSAACALYTSYEEIYATTKKVMDTVSKATSLRQLTWPTISIFSGKPIEEKIAETCEQMLIEDLELPFFCISLMYSSSIIESTSKSE